MSNMLKSSSNFSWTKAADSATIDIPGTSSLDSSSVIWKRHETSMEFGSSPNHQIIISIHLSQTHSLPQELNLEIVKTAVRQLRFDHPAIAVKHGWSGQRGKAENAVFTYRVPKSEDDIDKWLSNVVLDKRNVLEASNGDVEGAIAAVRHDLGKPGAAGVDQMVIHYIPAASSNGQYGLVFFFNHSVFDAVGGFQMIDLCLSKIAGSLAAGGKREYLPWGEETSRLPPALCQVTRIPYTAEKTPEDQVMIQKVKNILESFKNAHKMPIPNPYGSQTVTGISTKVIPADTLMALRTAARAHGCTVFGVLFAAMVLSCVRAWPPFPDDTRKIDVPFAICPINIRSLASDDVHDKSQWTAQLSLGFNSYTARDIGRFVHPSSENGPQQLLEDVWILGKEVKKQVDEQNIHKERAPVWADDMMGTVMQALSGENTGTPTTWGAPTLSSIGIMDKYLAQLHPVTTGGELIVSSPRLSPTYPNSSGLALHAFTWGEELILPFTFPEGVMGSLQDQAIALKEGNKEASIVLQIINQFMHILDVASHSN